MTDEPRTYDRWSDNDFDDLMRPDRIPRYAEAPLSADDCCALATAAVINGMIANAQAPGVARTLLRSYRASPSFRFAPEDGPTTFAYRPVTYDRANSVPSPCASAPPPTATKTRPSSRRKCSRPYLMTLGKGAVADCCVTLQSANVLIIRSMLRHDVQPLVQSRHPDLQRLTTIIIARGFSRESPRSTHRHRHDQHPRLMQASQPWCPPRAWRSLDCALCACPLR